MKINSLTPQADNIFFLLPTFSMLHTITISDLKTGKTLRSLEGERPVVVQRAQGFRGRWWQSRRRS
jgi:hypothetical protein